jgi:large subunit ribosomal protein L24
MDSIQPRKQRKFRYDAPLHLRRKMVSSRISDELAAKLGTKKRNAPLHKGDRVKVMRGESSGKVGKVTEVDLMNLKAYVEGVTARNAKGVEKPRPLDPSNLMIMEGEFVKDRLEMVKRAAAGEKKK